MKQKRYVIALLLAAVVISGVSYVSAEAHNTIGETPVPTPNITVTVEVGPPRVSINMSTELPASYTPDWKPGDWWMLQKYFHPQSWPTGWNMYWQKYVVVKCEEVVSKGGNRRTFYKVKGTTAHSDNSTHWTDMYFMKDNTLNTLSLYRVEKHDYHRGKMKMYVKEYGTIDYPAPVTPTFGSPLDVPVFPLTTEKSEEIYDFVKGHAPVINPLPPATPNMYKIKQEVAVSEVEDKGPGMFVIGSRIFTTTYKVTLTNVCGKTVVTQYWHPSAPWALYGPSADWTVHLTSWGSSEQPEEVSVVSEENSSEWWVSEPEEEVSVVSEEESSVRENSEPVKGVTYRKGSELPQKRSVPVKGVTYQKGYEPPQESSAPFKGIYLPKK